ncbi:MAG: transposase [candidate division Zixibacteria bacterium]|nr:transposase [candidate division Zixibacteria bacterium]MDD5425159.1 transposase [candidate division Zixibacteria bacterium]
MGKELFIKYLDSVRLKYGFQIYGYAVMPEHIHLVICPRQTMQLGLVIREIKSKMAREYFVQRGLNTLEGHHVFWQKRCYEHNCRSWESVIEKINYCHMNPV